MKCHTTTLTVTLATCATFVAAQPSDMIQNETLPMPNGGVMGAYAGTSVAIDGHFAVVGRPGFSGEVTGDAIVYEYDNTLKKWTYFETLIANDGIAEEAFGESVAICDGAIIVGRPEFNFSNGVGSAFVYFYDEANKTWGTPTKLSSNNTTDTQWFGCAVDITNDGSGVYTAIIGASQDDHDGTNGPSGSTGSAYVFNYTPSGGWSSGTALYPTSTDTIWFGGSVALNDDYFVVGAPRSGNSTSAQGLGGGAVYLYDRTSGTGWSNSTVLIPSTLTDHNFFGSSVAADNDLLVVGADGERGVDIDATAEGKVYVYSLTGATPSLDQTLLGHYGGINDNFGTSVSVSGDAIVVGASQDSDLPATSGTASIFRYANGSWSETYRTRATSNQYRDHFGGSVAISGTNIIVGAPSYSATTASGTLPFSGAIFAYKKAVCLEIDYNDDGRVNFFDVSAFLAGFKNEAPFADLTNDGNWNFFDVSQFLEMYEGDCQ